MDRPPAESKSASAAAATSSLEDDIRAMQGESFDLSQESTFRDYSQLADGATTIDIIDDKISYRGLALDLFPQDQGLTTHMHDSMQTPNRPLEDVQLQHKKIPAIPEPPVLPDYPYMLNRNNYDLPVDHTFAMFYPLLERTLHENGVDRDPISQNCKLRCLAYPHGEKVEFNIAAYQRPTNGAIIIEFQRYDGASHLYYVLLHSLKKGMNLHAEGEPSKPMAMPQFDDDLNYEYVPTPEEIAALKDMMKQNWAQSRANGMQLAESMLANPGAEQPLMQKGIVQAVTECGKGSTDTEVRRCAARVLRKIASSPSTASHLDVAAAELIVDLMRLPAKTIDPLPLREVQYQSTLAVEHIMKNNAELIGELKKAGAEQAVGDLLDCTCSRVAEAAQGIAHAL